MAKKAESRKIVKKVNPKENLSTVAKKATLDKTTTESNVKKPTEKTSKSLKKITKSYMLIPHFAKANISKEGASFMYKVEEPLINKEQLQSLEKLKEYVIEVMDADLVLVDKNKEEYIETKFNEYLKIYKPKLTETEKDIVRYYLKRDFLGLEKIEPMMNDPNIEDISCDGIGIPIYINHKEYGSMKTNIVFEDHNSLESFVIKLSQKCGRFISYGEPLLDGSLPDGSRVNATFGAGVTVRGPSFDIRKFRKIPFTPLDLIDFGTLDYTTASYLWMAIEQRKNLLIAGGTASGKSTLLNAISLFIPENLKIVSIEDTAELNLLHENWIQSVARSGVGSATGSYGEVTMFDLLKASFRQRPDYVIVGEVRGVEATVLFQGMASGHSGLGTIHAESLEAVIQRLSTPPINLPPSLIKILDILILQVSATEISANARRVKAIQEIRGDNKEVSSETIFEWDSENDITNYFGNSVIIDGKAALTKASSIVVKSDKGKVPIKLFSTQIGEVKEITGKTKGQNELMQRIKYLKLMQKVKIDFREFPVWIHIYQDDPEKAFRLLKEKG